MATFEQYNRWRETLVELIGRAVEATDTLSLTEKGCCFSQLQKQLKNDTFKIQIVGTVKNGKSSFTNALLGENILPISDIPCTAVVSEVKFGDDKKAVVHFCSPLPTGLLNEIPEETRSYIRRYNYGKDKSGQDVPIPPLEIPYDQLDKYVAIPQPSMDILFDAESLKAYRAIIDKESPYDVVELYFPAEILRNGVELVDSPGLNESPVRTKVTLKYLEQADAAIYLLDAIHPITADEQLVIKERLVKSGFTDLLMVANRIDLVNDPKLMKLFIQAHVQNYTSNKEVFVVSAKNALDGIKQNDAALIAKSGIPVFKEFLIDYLTRAKGLVKLNKPANQLKNIIDTDLIEKYIPECLASLNTEASVLESRLNDALPVLTKLRAKREKLANSLDQNIPLAIVPITAAICEYFDDLQNKINTWVDEFTPITQWAIIATRDDRQNVAKQILVHIHTKIEQDYNDWNLNTFQNVFQENSKKVFGTLAADIDEISNDIAKIDTIMNGMDPNHVPDIKVAERIAGIAAMLFLPMGRAGGEIFGGGWDLTKFLKNFAVDLGVGLGVGLVAVLIFPPLGLIAAIVGAITGMIRGGQTAMQKTKTKVANHIKAKLQENAPEQTKEIVSNVRDTFGSLKEAILKGVDSEIDTQQAHINEIRNITENGQLSIEEKRQKLNSVNKELVSVREGLDSLLKELRQNQ